MNIDSNIRDFFFKAHNVFEKSKSSKKYAQKFMNNEKEKEYYDSVSFE